MSQRCQHETSRLLVTQKKSRSKAALQIGITQGSGEAKLRPILLAAICHEAHASEAEDHMAKLKIIIAHVEGSGTAVAEELPKKGAVEKRGRPSRSTTRKPWPRRSTSWTSITSVAGAILVDAPTLGGWYLLQGQAVAISRTTGICALLFSGLRRREGARGGISVARIKCSRIQRQKRNKEYGDDGERWLAIVHGSAP
jgi:hypothetical protein